MLYFLKSTNSEKTFYLIKQNEFIVGRKDCDIIIEKDSSISRKHVKIQIKKGKKGETVTIEDLGSKYKTFHNGQEVTPNVEVPLKNNDKIKFGGLSSVFTFHQENFVTTATKLSSVKKDELNNQLKLLRGQYLDNWTSDCTHLTLEHVNLTVKVLQALLDNKPLVSPSFWEKYTKNVMNNLPPPNINDHNDPPVAEALLTNVDLRKPVNRKDLFKNKTFLFLNEPEKKQVAQLIQKAGGIAISWEKNPTQLESILQSPQEFILMQTTQTITDKNYDDIVKHFSKKNMRTIPIPEIAMAIINGSCEKDCNPAFNRAEVVFHAKRTVEVSQQKPLAESTQSQSSTLNEKKAKFSQKTIPESLDSQIDSAPVKKRKKTCVSEEDKVLESKEDLQSQDENPFKRIKFKKSLKEGENSNTKANVFIDENAFQRKSQSSLLKQNSLDNYLQSDSSKRLPSKDIDEENPFKRIKIKNPTWSTRVTSQGNQGNETIKDSDEQGGNPFQVSQQQKRKADSTEVNPFMDVFKMRKTVRTDNTPFEPLKPTSRRTISSDNPFLTERDKTINDSSVFSSTKIGERNETLYYTKSTSNNTNAKWISKDSPSENMNQKEEKDVDEYQQRIIDLFKNKLIVEVRSQLVIRSRQTSDEVDCSVASVVNFKKFKKVKPLHPQTTVISMDSLVVRGCRNVTSINEDRRLMIDSDDETPNPKQNKRRLKTFDI